MPDQVSGEPLPSRRRRRSRRRPEGGRGQPGYHDDVDDDHQLCKREGNDKGNEVAASEYGSVLKCGARPPPFSLGGPPGGTSQNRGEEEEEEGFIIIIKVGEKRSWGQVPTLKATQEREEGGRGLIAPRPPH